MQNVPERWRDSSYIIQKLIFDPIMVGVDKCSEKTYYEVTSAIFGCKDKIAYNRGVSSL